MVTVLWLFFLATAHGLIEVDNSVETEYSLTTEETVHDNFVIFTVASEANDPYMRYVRSLKVFGMDKYLQVCANTVM